MRFAMRAACAALFVLTASCRDQARLLRVDGSPIVAPKSIDFGLISIHDTAQQSVKLINAGRAPLRINGVQVQLTEGGSSLTSAGAKPPFAVAPTQPVPLTLRTNESTTLGISFVPNGVGPIRGVVQVSNDSFEQPMATVELRGEAIDAQATISPSQLDFGKIEVGTQAMQALTVANDTPLAVTVTPTLQGSDTDEFSTRGLTVPAHTTLQMPVTFSPTRLGTVASAVSVTRCQGCQADVINLYGEGIDSAMVVDPNPMNFGSVPIDASGHVACRLINVSSVPLELKGVALAPNTDESYVLEQQVPDYILPPGAWLATSVRFSPTHLGPANGALQVFSSSKRHPTLSVPLIGTGGGAEIAVAPDRVDFGDVPVGGEGQAVVHVRNAGTAGNMLTIYRVAVGSTSNIFQVQGPQLPTQLAAGQALDFTVSFDPAQAGPAGDTLTVTSSDGSAPTISVPLTGNGRSVMPCKFSLAPGQIDFGNVPPGSGAVLGLRFTNQGTDLCAVRNVHVGRTGGGAFFMPGGPIPSLILWPGDSFQTQVAFKPQVQGLATGDVTMTVTDPSAPQVKLDLTGRSEPACLTAAPPFIDFGALRRDCHHADRSTHLVNACNASIDVNRIWLGSGTTSEFSLVTPPVTPLQLAPGAGFTVTVGYAAQQQGQNFAPLFLQESDAHDPYLVPLLGEGLPDGNTTDHFVQADGTKSDVLFVVDNSNSMAEEQPRLEAAIPAFVQAARAKGMDLHVGVTTTGIDPVSAPGCNGGVGGGEAGRLFPVDHSAPRIVDLTQPNAEQLVQSNVTVGECTHLEQGLEAMRRALSHPLVDSADDPVTPEANDGNLGFLRDDAQLSVVVVSDEDDHSGDEVNDYATFLRSVHGLAQPQRVGFFAIAPLSTCATSSGSSAPRYSAMAQASGGQVWDACSQDYGPALAAIADRSFGAQTRFPLTQLADPSTLAVTVDGQAAGGWTYDAATNAVVFNTAPAPGAHVDVSYKQACPP